MPITTLYENSEGRIGQLGSLMVAYMRQTTSLEFLDALLAAQEKICAVYPRFSNLSVLAQVKMRNDEQVRARAVEINDRYEKRSLGTALVVVSRGLSGASVRTALSLFFMVSRRESPIKVFSSVADGLSWLRALPAQDPLLHFANLPELEHFISGVALTG